MTRKIYAAFVLAAIVCWIWIMWRPGEWSVGEQWCIAMLITALGISEMPLHVLTILGYRVNHQVERAQ